MLQDILDPNVIEVGIDVTTKDEAIRFLSNKLYKAGYISDITSFVEDIYMREAEGKTGIGNYIAIPHGQSSSVNKNGIAIGLLKNEIPWETLDGKGVKLVCLFCVDNREHSGNTHLQMLASLAGKLGNDDLVLQMLTAKNAVDIIGILK